MTTQKPFKWRHFLPEIILLNVRWYMRYSLSYRNLEEMMLERSLKVDHSTINRWVLFYSPEIDKRARRYLKPTNDSWRVYETYIKETEVKSPMNKQKTIKDYLIRTDYDCFFKKI